MHGIGCTPAGCGLGMAWSYLGHGEGYLGDDPTAGIDVASAVDITSAPLATPDLSILSPSAPPVSVDQLNTYVTTGQADPSILGQLSQLVSAAGPAVNSILQQYQFGQLAASTPISSLAQLRAAVTGAPVSTSSIVSSLTSNPMFLVLGAGLLFLLFKKGK